MNFKLLTIAGTSRVGGMEAFFASFCRAMVRAGVSVHAVVRHDNIPTYTDDLAAAGVTFDTLHFEPVTNLLSKYRLKQIAQKFQPDLAMTFASRASHCVWRGDYPILGRLGGYYDVGSYKKCDYLVCNTPDIVRHVIDRGWPRNRVAFIPNYTRIDAEAPIDRAQFDTPEGVPLALALGRLNRDKALDVFLRAAARIPDLWVWIAGDGEEREPLATLAAALDIANRVRFLGWRTDRAAVFGAADLCVYPSRHEPFGNVVLEAWAYGKPLVTSDASGPAWLVHNGEDGVVVPVEDAEALARGIRDIIANPEFAAELVRNGQARLAREFSEDAVIGQYLALMERLMAQRKARAAE